MTAVSPPTTAPPTAALSAASVVPAYPQWGEPVSETKSAREAPPEASRPIVHLLEIAVPALVLALLTEPVVWGTGRFFDSAAEQLADSQGADMRTSGEKGDGRSLPIDSFGFSMTVVLLVSQVLRWYALCMTVSRPLSSRTTAALISYPAAYAALALLAYVLGGSTALWFRATGLILQVALACVVATAVAGHVQAPDSTVRNLILLQMCAEAFLFIVHVTAVYPWYYSSSVSDVMRVAYVLLVPFLADPATFPARRLASTRLEDQRRLDLLTVLGVHMLSIVHLISRGFVVGMSTTSSSLAAAVAASAGELGARFTLSRRDAFYERVLCRCCIMRRDPDDEEVRGRDRDVAARFLAIDQVLEMWATVAMGSAFIAFRISTSQEPPDVAAQLGLMGVQLALEAAADVGPAVVASALQRRSQRARAFLARLRRKHELLRTGSRTMWALVALIAVSQTWAFLFNLFVPDRQRFFCVWPSTDDPDWFRVPCTQTEEWLDG